MMNGLKTTFKCLRRFVRKIMLIYKNNKCLNESLERQFKLFNTGKKRILLTLTPDYGNIGDHLIALAERRFLNDRFPDYQIDEISMRSLNKISIRILKKNAKYYENIIITGGGFLGSLWPDFENASKWIIKAFLKKNIIIFPQTVYYDGNKREINKTKKLYGKCKSLNIFVRDKSYDWVVRNLKVSDSIFVYNVPDIALYLTFPSVDRKFGKVLVCLRKDKERILPNNDENRILDFLGSDNFLKTDTIVQEDVSIAERERYCKSKIDEFCKARLVITDRLHGMIMAVITSTPCLAFNNISNKVGGVYQLWLKNEKNVRFSEKMYDTGVLPVFNEIKKYDPSIYEKYWKILENAFSE